MRSPIAAACLLFAALPILAQNGAAPPKQPKSPEALVPAGSLFYFRFDGIHPHRKAYQRTILAKLLKEEFGDFLGECGKLLKKSMQERSAPPPVVVSLLAPLEGEPAEAHKKAEEDWQALEALCSYLYRHGIVVAHELIDRGRRYQFTVVFPSGGKGKNLAMLQRLLRSGTAGGDEKPKVIQLRGRKIAQVKHSPLALVPAKPPPGIFPPQPQQVPAPETYTSWWSEGDHLVLTIGTEPVRRALDVIDGELPNLTSNDHFKKLAGFRQYETCARGFLDIRPLVDLCTDALCEGNGAEQIGGRFTARMILRQLGLTGLKSLSWHWGFEGEHQRGTTVLHVPERGARPGLLRLVMSPVSVKADDLPPLPPDTASLNIYHLDAVRIFDEIDSWYKLNQMKKRLDEGKFPFGGLKSLNGEIQKETGIDLRGELLSALDGTMVTWQANSEGRLLLGRSLAVKVKDAARVEKALAKLAAATKKLGNNAEDCTVKTTAYRGSKLHTLYAKGLPVAPTYTLHGGWLVVSLYPQPVKAYLARAAGGKVWQPPPVLISAIEQGLLSGNKKTKLASVSVSDPRPKLDFLLPFAPLLLQMANSEWTDGKGPAIDLATIPHARAVTQHLTPNVTVFFDDGDALRWETHSSLPLPPLLEMYLLAGMSEVGEVFMPRWAVPPPAGAVPAVPAAENRNGLDTTERRRER